MSKSNPAVQQQENKEISELRHIADEFKLSFSIEGTILPEEPVLAIVNKREKTLSVVSRQQFAEKQGISWTDSIINFPKYREEETRKLKEVSKCKKALLVTDYGFGVVNLTPIKKGAYVSTYEGIYYEKEEDIPDAYTDCYLLRIDETLNSWVSAKTKRGFGGYLQSLLSQDELEYYQFKPEDQKKISLANLKFVNTAGVPLYVATQAIPALTQLGSHYNPTYFWAKNQPQVPFSLEDGHSLSYEVAEIALKLIDHQFGHVVQKKNISIDYIQEHHQKDIDTIGYGQCNGIILKSEEVKKINEGIQQHKQIYICCDVHHTPAIVLMFRGYHEIIRQTDAWPIAVKHSLFKLLFASTEGIISLLKKIAALPTKALASEKHLLTKKEWFEFFECKQQFFVALCEMYKEIPEITSSATAKEHLAKQKHLQSWTDSIGLISRRAAAKLDVLSLWLLIQFFELNKVINEPGAGSGKTALHWAVGAKESKEKFSTCCLLLQVRASLDLKDSKGLTPKDYPLTSQLSQLFKNHLAEKKVGDAIIKEAAEKAGSEFKQKAIEELNSARKLFTF